LIDVLASQAASLFSAGYLDGGLPRVAAAALGGRL